MGAQAATNGKIQYIEQALSKGFSAAQIANGLSMSESAVSQLISSYNIKVGGSSKKAAELDDIYDDLEHKTAALMGKALAVCELDPVRLSVVLSRLNAMKRRSYGEGQGVTGGAAGALVALQLPQQVNRAPDVTLSSRNEIVEIEGRTIATIDRGNLNKLSGARLENMFAPANSGIPASLPAAQLIEASKDAARDALIEEANHGTVTS